MLKVGIISLGCPKNLVDSEKMLALLAEAGCVVAAPLDDADVILVNTCGFLESSRLEAIEAVEQAVELKKNGSAKRVVVTGCLPSRFGAASIPGGVDAVIGVNEREKIVHAVMGDGGFIEISDKIQKFGPDGCPGDSGRFRLTAPHTAYLRIAEGCDQKCTFCVIPQIRGQMRSKPAEMVLAEAKELLDGGTFELNVIAQDTTAWGQDFDDGKNLAWLLRQLNDLPDAGWIRLMYTYPRNFSDELIAALQQCDHVLPYIDMPLQHISTSVLKRMGRRTDRKKTEDLLWKLRNSIDGLVIRTSLIVGFPGETEREFRELADFVEDFRFDALGVFEFSPEQGAAAAKLPDQVPMDVAAARAGEIMSIQYDVVRQANESIVGQMVEVLVDGSDSGGVCFGRYYGQAPDIDGVCILTKPRDDGSVVTGHIVDTMEYDLIVEPVE